MLDNFKDVFGQTEEGDVFSAEETVVPKPQAVQIEKDANSKAAKKQKLHPTLNKRRQYAVSKKALS